MIVLDTCVLIYDALTPNKLSKAARRALSEAERKGQILCSDISLWEIAMLIAKKRLDPATDYLTFIKAVLAARTIQVKDISPEVAQLAVAFPAGFTSDPADRIIAATAVHYDALLVTCDTKLVNSGLVKTLW
ncbi:MAG: type II toxin-antitoxin system VapC family toxin [Gammaproteobacteria bacterium]